MLSAGSCFCRRSWSARASSSGVLILLGRAFAVTVRESGHPRLIIAGLLGLAGAIVLLTYLGVELPRE